MNSADTNAFETEVLVVGAGPTGLMLANQLARRGVRPLIIDRHSGPAQQTRAMAVQARTLEIYAAMGLADTAVARGAIGGGANIWANGRWRARVPIGDVGRSISPFPYVLMLGQDENERILGARLAEQGVDIHWSTELLSFRQKPDGVEGIVKLPDGGERAVRAAWVAGCDGARSTVRERTGIGFPGAPYEHTFFVADTEAVGPMKPGELNVYLWRDGFHLFFPMRGSDRWRVIGILPEALRRRDDLVFDEVIPAIRGEAGSALQFKRCDWFSTYRIHHRAAERFREGRCFILGDAAHVHSPMGAQGMNTGLQDAYNLAWKLALVIQGRAAPALLDSYEQERIPVARRLLKTTDRAFQLVVSDGFVARALRTRLLARLVAFAMRFTAVRRRAFRTISQTGIRYRGSALSRSLGGLPGGAPAAGDRFPWLTLAFAPGGAAEDLFAKLDDTRFNLLLFGQTLPPGALDAFGAPLRVHEIPVTDGNEAALSAASIPSPSFYLLRPDGHAGLCGARFDAGAAQRYATSALYLTGTRLPEPLAVSARC